MMTYLDTIGWLCKSCLNRWTWSQEAIATDPDPEMHRRCVECGC